MTITPQQFEEVCDQIEETTFGLTYLCGQAGFNKRFFYEYMKHNEEARNRYARAKEIQCDLIAEETIDIADNATNDFMTVVKGDFEYEAENKEVINRSRLRVDTRKWLLSKLCPKKYGDKIDVTTGGDKLQQPPSVLSVRVVGKDE